MKVIVLNWLDRENPRAGGAEVHLHEIFGRLAERGHEITAVTSRWPGAGEHVVLDGMEIRRVGSRLTYGLAAARSARRELADGGFDLVVEDLNKAPLFTPLWAPAPTLLLVHHLFGGTAFGSAPLPVAAATWALERGIPSAYGDTPTVAVSESTRRDLVRRGLPEERIRVVRNGVDTRALTPVPDGGRFEEPTILYLGRLTRYKRVELIVAAAKALRREGHPVRLVIAGTGEEEGRLRRLVDRSGLEGTAVSFLGRVSEDTKRDLFRRAWVHVLTSEKEGWGITNLEAAACGTPSVASDAPGLRDSVLDGETGFLVPHGDVAALADRILRLVTDPRLRAEQGRAARSFAERHSWESATEEMDEALTWAVDSAREHR